MTTRKIIDPKQNGEKVWLKGHAQAIYMSDGTTVEDAIKNINISYTETDPVFSDSVASSITSSDITNWNNKTSNTGTITEIKMNGVSKGKSGIVDLGTVITDHQDISGKQDIISDLDTIRSGAALGATAVQTPVMFDIIADMETKTNAAATYLGKTEKAASATIADSAYVAQVAQTSETCTGNSSTATKATQDLNGNNIVNTYATKDELSNLGGLNFINFDDLTALSDVRKAVLNNKIIITVDTADGSRHFYTWSVMNASADSSAFLCAIDGYGNLLRYKFTDSGKSLVSQSTILTASNGIMQDGTVTNIVALTQAEYDALTTKKTTTLYIITDA